MKLKWSLFIVAGMMSVTAFAQEQKTRIETRSRVVGENLIYVGECSEAELTTSSYNTPIINKNGEMARTQDGTIRVREVTRLTAKSKRKIGKCQTTENYQVNVTGSMWNHTVSEIPNSGKASSSVVFSDKGFTEDQEVDMKQLGNAVGGGSLFRSSNSADLLFTIEAGLKAKAKAACENSSAELNLALTAKSATGCR